MMVRCSEVEKKTAVPTFASSDVDPIYFWNSSFTRGSTLGPSVLSKPSQCHDRSSTGFFHLASSLNDPRNDNSLSWYTEQTHSILEDEYEEMEVF